MHGNLAMSEEKFPRELTKVNELLAEKHSLFGV